MNYENKILNLFKNGYLNTKDVVNNNIPRFYLTKLIKDSKIERVKRISISKYKGKFIIKGGLLLSSIFGVILRSTMDLDTTIKGLPLDKETITKVINEIINIDLNDNVKLEIENIKDIREEELYSGFNVNLKWNDINKDTLRKAIINTAKNRGTLELIDGVDKYLELISDDNRLKSLWNSYQNNYEYAKEISFDDTIKSIKVISELIVLVEI